MYEDLDIASTPTEMRKALQRAQHSCSVVRYAMMLADDQGLSGEDTYVAVAYHAVGRMLKLQDRLLEEVNTHARPPVMIVESEEKKMFEWMARDWERASALLRHGITSRAVEGSDSVRQGILDAIKREMAK